MTHAPRAKIEKRARGTRILEDIVLGICIVKIRIFKFNSPNYLKYYILLK